MSAAKHVRHVKQSVVLCLHLREKVYSTPSPKVLQPLKDPRVGALKTTTDSILFLQFMCCLMLHSEHLNIEALGKPQIGAPVWVPPITEEQRRFL